MQRIEINGKTYTILHGDPVNWPDGPYTYAEIEQERITLTSRTIGGDTYVTPLTREQLFYLFNVLNNNQA